MTGKVYLVGAGPGDPGLMTVKGLELLRTADIVMYDALANPELLKECKDGAQLIDAGKRGGDPHLKQWETNELLVKYASEGKIVVRLKGGDPFLSDAVQRKQRNSGRRVLRCMSFPESHRPSPYPNWQGSP